MSHNKVLQKLEEGQLDALSAYDQLYEPSLKESGKRAFFVKMNISVPEEGKGVNTFLKVLFLIPFPIVFVRLGLKIFSRKIRQYSNQYGGNNDIDLNGLLQLVKYSKGTVIEVESEDANIDIKVI